MKIRTVVLMMALLAVATLLSAQPAPPAQVPPVPPVPAAPHMHGMPMEQGAMPMDCAAMMKQHEEMQAKMKAADDRLEKLVATMKTASGSKKTDATAAVVAELVAQHQAMHKDMETMMPQMMQHMMQHMQSGMAQGMKSGMNCPMMKETGEAPAPAPHN